MYDIAIIGAGPAGANLARLLGKSHKILLIDKRQLDSDAGCNSPIKCCGGLLAPDAQKIIAELGLGLPQNVLVGPQLFAVRTIDMEKNVERYYQRFYINVDREKIDRWLVSLIPPSVDMRFGCKFKAFESMKDGFKICFSQAGKEYVEQSKLIVGADGANSMIRKQAFADLPAPKKYISIQEWYEAEVMLPYFSAIFDREISDFYSWTIPKDGYFIVGAALEPDNQATLKFELLKKKLSKYDFNLKKKVKREGAFIYRPQSLRSIFTGKDGIMLIGEAAGWISPSSAEGFSYAFRSSLALAQAIKENADSIKAYNNKTRGLKGNILVKNLKSPFMYSSLLRKIVMSTGIQSMNIPIK